jgi:hypothetical protein
VTPDAYTLTDAQQAGLRDLCDAGLCTGKGEPRRGGTCALGALSLVLGGEFTDAPRVVHRIDRAFLTNLNDAPWSSDRARGAAMFPLVRAAVGTAWADRSAWIEAIALGTVQRVLSRSLRAFGVESLADQCAGADTLAEAGRHVRAAADYPVDGWFRDVAWQAHDTVQYACMGVRPADPLAAHYAVTRAVGAAKTAAAKGTYKDADEMLRVAVGIALEAYRVAP